MTNSIKLTPEQIKTLSEGGSVTIEGVEVAQEEAVKLWEPSGGEWLVNGEGKVFRAEKNSDFDYIVNGMRFETQEQAEYAAKQYKIYHWMFKAWLEVVGDWRPDWTDVNQTKYHMYWDHRDSKFFVDNWTRVQESSGFHFPTEAQAQKWAGMVGHLIKELGV